MDPSGMVCSSSPCGQVGLVVTKQIGPFSSYEVLTQSSLQSILLLGKVSSVKQILKTESSRDQMCLADGASGHSGVDMPEQADPEHVLTGKGRLHRKKHRLRENTVTMVRKGRGCRGMPDWCPSRKDGGSLGRARMGFRRQKTGGDSESG